MGAEGALAFIRRLGQQPPSAKFFLIFGPHAFLREYVTSALRDRLLDPQCEYHGFQVRPGTGFAPVINEIGARGLFAQRKFVLCRVLRSRRERPESDQGADEEPSRGGGEEALIEAVERDALDGFLVLLYERDTAPAKVRRLAERLGISVQCQKPFDDQLPQYATLFARALGLKISAAAAQRVVARYSADLASAHNALSLAALYGEQANGFLEGEQFGADRVPDVFDMAERVARGEGKAALAMLVRALAMGRDSFEILAVEMIPVLRRMLLVASLKENDKPEAEVYRALGLAPTSSLAARAVGGARRFGYRRLEQAYASAARLDADFKAGRVRAREQALAGLMLELLGGAG